MMLDMILVSDSDKFEKFLITGIRIVDLIM
jgi:hypothetical protein